MECLHCGDCCRRMSPLSIGSECPKLVLVDTFYFCSDYKMRPKECVNHGFHFSRFCPIGLDILNLKDLDSIRSRIDEGFGLIKGGKRL